MYTCCTNCITTMAWEQNGLFDVRYPIKYVIYIYILQFIIYRLSIYLFIYLNELLHKPTNIFHGTLQLEPPATAATTCPGWSLGSWNSVWIFPVSGSCHMRLLKWPNRREMTVKYLNFWGLSHTFPDILCELGQQNGGISHHLASFYRKPFEVLDMTPFEEDSSSIIKLLSPRWSTPVAKVSCWKTSFLPFLMRVCSHGPVFEPEHLTTGIQLKIASSWGCAL